MLQLVAPTVDLREAWLEAHEEWGPGLHEDGFGLGPHDDTSTPAGFAAWVHRCDEDPGQLWWIVEGKDVVGGIALRAIDDPTNGERGHIGYGIRPSCRGRGLATWALGEVLREAGRRGSERVLVVCDASNLASARVAEHHGGRLESASDDPKRRYWISVSVFDPVSGEREHLVEGDRHGGLDPEVLEDVRLGVYTALAATGRLPADAELADIAGSIVRAGAAVQLLAEQRAWALGADGQIVLAHPFATRSFGYSVMSDSTLWWGGCAWDSFAIPHLVPDCGPVVIAGTCPACDRALAWRVDTSSAPEGSERAHFLVPTTHMWDDVIHTCSHQLLFCDDACIDRWLERTGNPEGYRMGLGTLWRFAAGWYAGRLDRGYRRREPSEALDYFHQVGLEGPFWGFG